MSIKFNNHLLHITYGVDDSLVSDLKRLIYFLGGETLYIVPYDYHSKRKGEIEFMIPFKYKSHLIKYLEDMGHKVEVDSKDA